MLFLFLVNKEFTKIMSILITRIAVSIHVCLHVCITCVLEMSISVHHTMLIVIILGQ